MLKKEEDIRTTNLDTNLKKPILVIDVDGTLAFYDGWKGPAVIGSPIKGSVEFTHQMRKDGWEIGIFTTRADVALVKQWLDLHEYAYDWINENPNLKSVPHLSNKPYWHAFIDDRCLNARIGWKMLRFAINNEYRPKQ